MIDSNNEESLGTSTLDTTKVYVIIMVALSVLCMVGIVYNQYTLSQYKLRLTAGERQLEKILEFETQLLPKSDHAQAQDIPEVFQFFKRFARNIAEPEVREEPLETRSQGDIKFIERRYVIRFEQGVSRQELVRYIYSVIEAKPFLRLKQLELQKLEGTAPYQDSWRGQLVFAYRKEKEE